MKNNLLVVGMILGLIVLWIGFVSALETRLMLLDGNLVRTHIIPANNNLSGSAPIYKVVGEAATGQLMVASVGRGDPGYKGGNWAYHEVMFKSGVSPYMLPSARGIEMALSQDHITIVRKPDLDFRAPIIG